MIAPALAALTVGYWIVLRRPLGVSGVLARFSRIREEAGFDRGAAVLQAEQAALEAAMVEMTAEAFAEILNESVAVTYELAQLVGHLVRQLHRCRSYKRSGRGRT